MLVAENNMKKIAADMAHELRTPLVVIKSCISSVKEYVTKFSLVYKKALINDLVDNTVDLKMLGMLLRSIDNAEKELYFTNKYVDMFCFIFMHPTLHGLSSNALSIKSCLMDAVRVYPYRSGKAMEMIQISNGNIADFSALANKPALGHLFFYLLGKLINSASYAKVEVGTSVNHKKIFNILIFRANEVIKIDNDDDFGLFFCKNYMKSIGGEIHFKKDEHNKASEIKLFFPVIN